MPARGGKVIGAGSDGCVFDGTFAENGAFTKSAGEATKVYTGEAGKAGADQEYAIMETVRDATGGVGVVVAERPPHPIATIPDAAWETAEYDDRSGCKRIRQTPGGPFYGLVLPRIDGTMAGLRGEPVENIIAKDVEDALASLSGVGKLAHMDMAVRNIFYKKEGSRYKLLIGDFGSSISFRGEDVDAGIQGFLGRYKLQGNILVCAKADGIYPAALALMIGYDALLRGEGACTALMTDIRNRDLVNKTDSLATASWICKALEAKTPDAAAFESFRSRLATQFEQIFLLLAGPDKTYESLNSIRGAIKSKVQMLLSRSDACMFAAMKELMSEKVDPKRLEAKWFDRRGGKRHMGGAVSLVEPVKGEIYFENLEDALNTEDPELVPNRASTSISTVKSPNEIIGPASTGGRRKTRRNRRGRGKMSRRV